MSVSDAAPLPRLGEVFFDVRGNSRSMRLSWYADTGVAVFSIWQAGMCTGTFRLPMADLGRMIEILERGPAPQGRGRAPLAAAQPGDAGDPGEWFPGQDESPGYGLPGAADGYQDYAADYGATERWTGGAGAGDYAGQDYRQAGDGGTGPAGQGRAERTTARYPADSYRPAKPPPGSHRRDADVGYHEDDFVPPYVQGWGESHPNDNGAEGGGYPGDAEDRGYPPDREPVSPADRYVDPASPEETYSYGSDYRYR